MTVREMRRQLTDVGLVARAGSRNGRVYPTDQERYGRVAALLMQAREVLAELELEEDDEEPTR